MPLMPQFIYTVDILEFHVCSSVSLTLTFEKMKKEQRKKKKKKKKKPTAFWGIRNQFQETLPSLMVNAATESKCILVCVCWTKFFIEFPRNREVKVWNAMTYCWNNTMHHYQWWAIFSMAHEQATSEGFLDPGQLFFPALTPGTLQCRDLLAALPGAPLVSGPMVNQWLSWAKWDTKKGRIKYASHKKPELNWRS